MLSDLVEIYLRTLETLRPIAYIRLTMKQISLRTRASVLLKVQPNSKRSCLVSKLAHFTLPKEIFTSPSGT